MALVDYFLTNFLTTVTTRVASNTPQTLHRNFLRFQ